MDTPESTHSIFRKALGETSAFLDRSRKAGGVDLLILLGLIGLFFGFLELRGEWTGALRPTVTIDLSPWALPRYAFFSLSRGMLAYLISLGFTLVYGYWAAKNRAAERVLVPLLDILQSVPVLGFMPGLVLGLVAFFPRSNVGLELAAVVMIFTGQAWNMTFSFYYSLRSVPKDLQEAGVAFRFSWWQRFKWVELPSATMGLVWNSMMSMAGGWFFLMISEAFVLGDKDFRLPGVGSYMSVAVAQGNIPAMLWAIVAMVLMIIILDQLLWRPVVVWAQKFRIEEDGHQQVMTSWFLDVLRHSRLVRWIKRRAQASMSRPAVAAPGPMVLHDVPQPVRSLARIIPVAALAFLLMVLLYGAWRLIGLVQFVSLPQWANVVGAAFATLGRVLTAVALGTVWALPAGLAIGLSPRLSRTLQPVVQVAASFPAPMLFPMVIAALAWAGVALGWGSILLMLLGTQWYILFNVIAGAMAIPSDLREAARTYRIKGWQRFKVLYAPSVFPYLITGWVTAAGGAWNASIVSEYVMYKGQMVAAWGLGSQISKVAAAADFPLLAASVMVMAVMVVLFNRMVWRRFYRVAADRFSLSR
jgi:NitT/TauT family transport system permease protein